MSGETFKPGDRVRVTDAYPEAHNRGRLGMVTDGAWCDQFPIRARLDGVADDWPFRLVEIEPAPPAPVAGEAGALAECLADEIANSFKDRTRTVLSLSKTDCETLLAALRAAPAPAPEVGEAMVERAAKAIMLDACPLVGVWEQVDESDRMRAREAARAALTAALAGAERASGKDGK